MDTIIGITQPMCTIVDEWAFTAVRLNIIPKYNVCYLGSLMEMRSIEEPSPVWLGPSLAGFYKDKRLCGPFGTSQIYETERSGTDSAFPHLKFLSYQPAYGRNGSILYGELFQLICAMRNRAHQRKVDNEDEQEALHEEQVGQIIYGYPRGVNKYDFEFPNEREFPILMASFEGPHH